ncbi:MAG: tetratricopeptide repeat protein [Planctomycetota bacterium]
MLASLAEDEGNRTEALDHYERVLELDPRERDGKARASRCAARGATLMARHLLWSAGRLVFHGFFLLTSVFGVLAYVPFTYQQVVQFC